MMRTRPRVSKLVIATLVTTVATGSLAATGSAQEDASSPTEPVSLEWSRGVEPGLSSFGKPVGLATDGSTVVAVAIAPATKGRVARVWTSTDGGDSWAQVAKMPVAESAELDVVYGDSGFSVLGPTRALISADGSSWTTAGSTTALEPVMGADGRDALDVDGSQTASDGPSPPATPAGPNLDGASFAGADIVDLVLAGDGRVHVLGTVKDFRGKRIPAMWTGRPAEATEAPTLAEAGAAYERMSDAYNKKQAKLLSATLPSAKAARKWAKRMAATYTSLVKDIESYAWPAEATGPMADLLAFMENSEADFRTLASVANDTKRWNRQIKRMSDDREWNAVVAIAVRKSLDLPLSKALRKLKRQLGQ